MIRVHSLLVCRDAVKTETGAQDILGVMTGLRPDGYPFEFLNFTVNMQITATQGFHTLTVRMIFEREAQAHLATVPFDSEGETVMLSRTVKINSAIFAKPGIYRIQVQDESKRVVGETLLHLQPAH